MMDTPIIPFGKHKGTSLTELPLDYLVWLQDGDKNPNGVIYQTVNWSKLAEQEFIRRKREEQQKNYASTLFGEKLDV